ncbi:uroporphyrinogen decarboxylase [Alphaproteobacteria bacterium]|nr:uroporphyrinogen decarboxylase [Alphaproteobacteria bacterium]
MENLLIKKLKGESTIKVPIWLMRQAGRYMEEYRNIRSKFPDFIKMCKNSDAVTEITLQPIKKFDFDAAIIFSDILVILDAIGIDVNFIEGIGPIVNRPENIDKFKKLPSSLNYDKVLPCYESIKNIKFNINKPLIGFAAAPWTLAAYFIEGKITKDLSIVKKFSYEYPVEMDNLIDLFTKLIIEHLKNQIKSGVDVIQIFDTHAYQMDYYLHEKYSIKQLEKISKEVRKEYKETPISFYTKTDLTFKKHEIEKSINCLSFNSNINMNIAKKYFSKNLCFQGNLDPLLLVVGGDIMKKEVLKILTNMQDRKFIFNLGHGILPQTPERNVHELINIIKSY